MTFNPVDVVAFDLDGTLLNDEKVVDPVDWATLKELNSKKILRIVATGRNYFSLLKVLPADFPTDFVVFSSGAGIIDWHSKKIIYCQHLHKTAIRKAVTIVLKYKLTFTIHLPIPNNHHILVHNPYSKDDDLMDYLKHYKEFVKPFHLSNVPKQATQLIVLLNHHIHLLKELPEQLTFLKTIVTTSPINHTSLWMELFHPMVSKANGVKWICEYLKKEEFCLMAIGNDFNDLDLLQFGHHSFVVENAPNALKEKYQVVRSNNKQGFTQAVKSIM